MNVESGIKTGFIGWFDILGYKSFLERSDLAHAVKVVREVQAEIRLAGTERFEGIVSCVPGSQVEEKVVAREVFASIIWMIFSDTVLLGLPVPEGEKTWKARLRIATFLELAKYVHLDFFFAGLPLRSAISFGRFYVHDNLSLFAGSPLVEAHDWAESQNWSGCVFTPSAERIVNQLSAESRQEARELLNMYSIRHPVCLLAKHSDGKTTREMLCLNWVKSKPGFAGMDVAGFVRDRFSAHNKDISSGSVQSKIDNTVEFIRAAADSGCPQS